VARRRITTKPVGTGAATARNCIQRRIMPEEVASMHQTVYEQESMQLPAFRVRSVCCTIAWQMQKETLHNIHVNVGWWMRTVGVGGLAWLCYHCWCRAYGVIHHSGLVIGAACLAESVGAGIVLPPSLQSVRMRTAFIAGRFLSWVVRIGRG
jgi:hypothetical protein